MVSTALSGSNHSPFEDMLTNGPGQILVLPILAADEVNKQPEHVVSRDVANDRVSAACIYRSTLFIHSRLFTLLYRLSKPSC